MEVLPDGHALIFARARHYDPKLGRWLQRDPKGYADGPNLYEAYRGNPFVLGIRWVQRVFLIASEMLCVPFQVRAGWHAHVPALGRVGVCKSHSVRHAQARP